MAITDCETSTVKQLAEIGPYSLTIFAQSSVLFIRFSQIAGLVQNARFATPRRRAIVRQLFHRDDHIALLMPSGYLASVGWFAVRTWTARNPPIPAPSSLPCSYRLEHSGQRAPGIFSKPSTTSIGAFSCPLSSQPRQLRFGLCAAVMKSITTIEPSMLDALRHERNPARPPVRPAACRCCIARSLRPSWRRARTGSSAIAPR